jgi:hypothetical protein
MHAALTNVVITGLHPSTTNIVRPPVLATMINTVDWPKAAKTGVQKQV